MADSPSGREGGGEQDSGPEDLRSDSKKAKAAVVMTSQPTNDSELQLYRVLQRANLLNYYDTFISQGGDDVQQLCEAGEEEFLEIMALVGMASKPLHVRRLQKALQEWVQNPAVFLTPLVPALGTFPAASAAAAAVIRASGMGNTPPSVSIAQSQAQAIMAVSVPTMAHSAIPTSLPALLAQARPLGHPSRPASGSPPLTLSQLPPRPTSAHSPSSVIKQEREVRGMLREREADQRPDHRLDQRLDLRPDQRPERPERVGSHPSPAPSPLARTPGAPAGAQEELRVKSRPPNLNPSWDLSTSEDAYSGDPPGPPTSPLQLTPVLVEAQIQRIAETAATLVKSLPDLEPKQPNIKKKICKELETNFFQIVMGMSDEDAPKKMNEIRKFSAIYGRFDCKRKPEKPLTLHEVSVNEAAAQICRLAPAMLTRRDELFPLARQVVRDSGYQYSKGHSRSQGLPTCKLFNDENGVFKRMRFSEDSEMAQRWRERMEGILEEARLCQERLEELKVAAGQARVVGDLARLQGYTQQLELYQAKQQELLRERDDHQRLIRFSSRMSTCSDPDRPDTDDDQSQRSYSNASSPSASLQAPPNYVLSASGGQIIAVQNPALSLSGAFPVGRGSPPSREHPGLTGLPRSSGSPSFPHSPGLKQEPSSPPRD